MAAKAAVQYTAGGFFGGDAALVWNAPARTAPFLKSEMIINVNAVGSTGGLVASVFDLDGNCAGSATVEEGTALITLARPLQFGGFRIGLQSSEPFKFYQSRAIMAGDGRRPKAERFLNPGPAPMGKDG